MSFLRPLKGLTGMFHCLFGMLVCGEFVEFGSSLMRVVWQSVSHPRGQLHLRTISFPNLFNWGHSRRGKVKHHQNSSAIEREPEG
jgi:hypothetical protein